MFSFPEDQPVAAYGLYLTFLSLQYRVLEGSFYAKFHKIQLIFPRFIVRVFSIFLSFRLEAVFLTYNTIYPSELLHPSVTSHIRNFKLFPICVLIKPSLHNTYNKSCNYYKYSTNQHVSALFGHQAYKTVVLVKIYQGKPWDPIGKSH